MINRRSLVGLLGLVPFVSLKRKKNVTAVVNNVPPLEPTPIIRPEGIVLTTALGLFNEEIEVPTFVIRSTCAEDIRRKHMRDFDTNMLAYLVSCGHFDDYEQYLRNRNDPSLTAWCKKHLLHLTS
jgi:hypothetical protein